MTDEGEVHWAERALQLCGGAVVLHMQVDRLGESGWDWHVWDDAGGGQQRYGLSDTLDEAKAKAEDALAILAEELRWLA